MSSTFSRRLFLGGSAAFAGAVASGVAVPLSHAAGGAAAAAGSLPRFGPAPGVAKLNANENPYGPSKRALAAMESAGRQGAYYVGDTVNALKDMIAERHGIPADQITLSAGSSGVLTYLAVAASRQGKILGPDLFWDTTAKKAVQQGGEILRIDRDPGLAIDLDAMYAAIDGSVALVQITNPNNPTGMLSDPDALREFCRKAAKKTIVLVDEAYNEITDDPEANTMLDLVKEGHNVVVARTFSKIYGLAGMRVGYMIASPENTELVNRFGLGDYAMNQAGVAAAIASYDDYTFLGRSKAKIIEAREMVTEAVEEAGLAALPSQTNFVFVNLGSLNAEVFRQKMAERNVLIRGIYRDYTNWSRVSMGRLEDVQKYVAALPAALEETAAAGTALG